MKDKTPITEEVVRQRTARFVRAALEAANMSAREFAKVVGLAGNAHISGYAAGKYSPAVDKILRMYEVTGVSPSAFNLPIINALKCAKRMREMIREGNTVSEFAKALKPFHRLATEKLIEGHPVTTLNLVKFHYWWYENNVEKLVQDPAFCESCGRRKSIPHGSKAEAEYKYIATAWGSLAESANEIRSGLWEWFSGSIYRMELEHMHDNIYEFRSYIKATDKLSVKREVKIV